MQPVVLYNPQVSLTIILWGNRMSNIKVTDRRGGKYQAIIEFTYGECERLPFNILRSIGARIETVPDGGVKAYADFNIRAAHDSALFLEMLDMFGEDGSFVHGSAADPQALTQTTPPVNSGTATVNPEDDLELEGTLNDIKQG